jgi:hypothetical protein
MLNIEGDDMKYTFLRLTKDGQEPLSVVQRD